MTKQVKVELIDSLDIPFSAPSTGSATASVASAHASTSQTFSQENVLQEIALLSSNVASRPATLPAAGFPSPAVSAPLPSSYQQFWDSFQPRT
jgi:hypothetical protein